MSADSIIVKHIGTIKGMYVKEARFIAAKIIKELAEEGYLVKETPERSGQGFNLKDLDQTHKRRN